ncbi:MAG: DUF899 family protein [Rhodospirillaceae bacterium]|jgi:predicted dithiol-disulfide oxidoreductase (DUF899 family)|nr:DUF899 family protein [Rhodospirillaceae bacterium]MBT5455370.1 DUF899 family protein [Rhodospirillaceae bacterium]
MGQFHNHTFPNETADYRVARDALLAEEMELRRQADKVSAMRRALPLGGAVNEDYVFQNFSGEDTKLSDLFTDKSPDLFIYNFMWQPGGDACPVCTSFMDSLNGAVLHIQQYYNVAVAAKAPAADLKAWAKARNWSNLNFLSSGQTTYNTDYKAEDEDGRQLMMLHAFRKTNDGIFHSWAFEMFYARRDDDQISRQRDRNWPLWSIFDVTLDGRPADWFPAYNYD